MSDTSLSNKFNALHLPDEIGNITVNELMNHPDSEVIKKGNKLSIRRRSEQGVATLEFASYGTGRKEMKTTSIPHREHKKDYKEDILAMKREGMTQKAIAFELGMSEAYVSRILK